MVAPGCPVLLGVCLMLIGVRVGRSPSCSHPKGGVRRIGGAATLWDSMGTPGPWAGVKSPLRVVHPTPDPYLRDEGAGGRNSTSNKPRLRPPHPAGTPRPSRCPTPCPDPHILSRSPHPSRTPHPALTPHPVQAPHEGSEFGILLTEATLSFGDPSPGAVGWRWGPQLTWRKAACQKQNLPS